MGILHENKTTTAMFGFGDIAVGVVNVKDVDPKKKPLPRGLRLNQIAPGTPGREIIHNDIDWEKDQIFIVFDNSDTCNLVIEKLYTILDKLKENGL